MNNYNIEPVLETGLVTLLTQSGLTAGASLTTDQLSTPRVDVQFQLGAEQGRAPSAGIGDIYEGVFVLSVITDRDVNNSSHSTYRASVRQILAETTGTGWAAVLGGAGITVLSLSHFTTDYNVLNNEAALDVSVMSYSAVIRLTGG